MGAATTLVAKMRGSSATTVIDSIRRSISITISSDAGPPDATVTAASRVSNPGRTSVTT